MHRASRPHFHRTPSVSRAAIRPSSPARAWALGLSLALIVCGSRASGQELDVPADKIPGSRPQRMMHDYWQRQAAEAFQKWRADYEARKTPEQIAAYQTRLREKFLQAIGGLPPRTPLEPQVTGQVKREGYRVEKILFESQPKHFVTGLLFLPEAARFKPPYPGVLVPCGHAQGRQGARRLSNDGRLAWRWKAWRPWSSIRSTRANAASSWARAAGPNSGASPGIRWWESAVGSWVAIRPASRSGTACAPSTISSPARKWIPGGSAAPATAAAARKPAT